MFRNARFITLIAVLLTVLLLWQVVAYAGGEDLLGSLCKIVAGVVVIAVGVATGGLVGGVVGVVVGGPLIEEGLRGDMGQDKAYVKPDKKPYEPPNDSEEVALNKLRIELDVPKDESNWAVVAIRIKSTESGNYILLPSGYSLWATHSASQVSLVKGDVAPTSGSMSAMESSAIDSSKFVDIQNMPGVIVPDYPAVISYSLQSQARSVQLDVLNADGEAMYTIAEAAPNPSRPIPFVWKGKKMDGSNVPAGAYSVRLMATRNDGASEYSEVSVMNIAEVVPAAKALSGGDGVQVDLNTSGVGHVTLLNTSSDPVTDVVWVKVKDSSGKVVSEVPVAQKAITFSEDPGGGIRLYPLHSWAIEGAVDGTPVSIVNSVYDPIPSEIIKTYQNFTFTLPTEYTGLSISDSLGTRALVEPSPSDTTAELDGLDVDEYLGYAREAMSIVEKMAFKMGIVLNDIGQAPSFPGISDVTASLSGDYLTINYQSETYLADLNSHTISTAATMDLSGPNVALNLDTVSGTSSISIMSATDVSLLDFLQNKSISKDDWIALVALLENRKREIKDLADIPENEAEAYSWSWPTNIGTFPENINSDFGPRNNPVPSVPALAYHFGLDFYAPSGTEVKSLFAGTVILVVNIPPSPETERDRILRQSGYGNRVMIRHKLNGVHINTLYGHLDSAIVNVGQGVAAGQVVGYADNTGYSSGDHLHLSLLKGRTQKNPLEYLHFSGDRTPEISDFGIYDVYGTEILEAAGSYVLKDKVKIKAEVITHEKDLRAVKFYFNDPPQSKKEFNYYNKPASYNSPALSSTLINWDGSEDMLIKIDPDDNQGDPESQDIFIIWLDTTTLANGNHTLHIKAVDVKDNYVLRSENIFVDN